MLKKLASTLSFIALFISSTSQALPIVEADAFAAGDNKAIYDLSSDLTWMDFGVTNGKSVNQIISELSSTYLGWRLPTDAEVNNLWGKLFSESWEPFYAGHHYSSADTALVENIMNVFGYNYQEWNWPRSEAAGFYLSSTGKLKYATISNYYTHSHATVSHLDDYYDHEATKNDVQGLWWSTLLVKQAQVSEPNSLFLLGLGLILCRARRYIR